MKTAIYKTILSLIIMASIVQFLSIGVRLWSAYAGSKTHAVSTVVVTPTVTPIEEVPQYLPDRIIIDKVAIDLPVVYAPLINGTWEVLPSVAHFAEGTSWVNEKEGNVGIFAHARGDAFLRIKELVPGDTIVLNMGKNKATYRVSNIDAVTPDTVNVFYPEPTPVLTLITCDGRFDEKRFMVRAELVSIEAYE